LRKKSWFRVTPTREEPTSTAGAFSSRWITSAACAGTRALTRTVLSTDTTTFGCSTLALPNRKLTA